MGELRRRRNRTILFGLVLRGLPTCPAATPAPVIQSVTDAAGYGRGQHFRRKPRESGGLCGRLRSVIHGVLLRVAGLVRGWARLLPCAALFGVLRKTMVVMLSWPPRALA